MCIVFYSEATHGTSSRHPAWGSSFAVLALNHRTRIARDRYHKQQNAEIQEVMRNDTRRVAEEED
jgi:hypothetical protein